MLRAMHSGLAAADDSFPPVNSPFGLPVYVAPLDSHCPMLSLRPEVHLALLPAGSIPAGAILVTR